MNKIVKGAQLPIRYHKNRQSVSIFNTASDTSMYQENIYNRIAQDVANFIPYISDKLDNHDNLVDIVQTSPSIFFTPIEFWRRVVYKMLTDGVAGVFVNRDKDGNIVNFEIADTVNVDIENREIEFTINAYKNRPTFNITPIKHLVFYNPNQSGSTLIRNITTIINERLNELTDEIERAKELQGFIKRPGLTDFQVNAGSHQKDMTEIIDGSVGGWAGIDDTAEVIQLNQKSGASTTSDTIDMLKQLIYEVYGVNGAIMSGNYTDEQFRAYMTSTVGVFTNVIEQELNKKLVSFDALRDGNKIKLVHDLYAGASLNDKVNMVKANVYQGVVSYNEAREDLGKPRVDGLDIFVGNLNQRDLLDDNDNTQTLQTGSDTDENNDADAN